MAVLFAYRREYGAYRLTDSVRRRNRTHDRTPDAAGSSMEARDLSDSTEDRVLTLLHGVAA